MARPGGYADPEGACRPPRQGDEGGRHRQGRPHGEEARRQRKDYLALQRKNERPPDRILYGGEGNHFKGGLHDGREPYILRNGRAEPSRGGTTALQAGKGTHGSNCPLRATFWSGPPSPGRRLRR